MIHIEQYGTGSPAYAAVHGWGGSHATFAPLAPYLPRDTSLLAVDLPGYGLSPGPVPASAPAVAAVVLQAVHARSVDPVTLIGNCSGAIIALLAASTPAARVSRVVLIDPFAFVPWYFRVFVARPWGRFAYASTFANPMGRWLTNASLRARRTTATDLTQSFRDIDHEASLQHLRLLAALGSIERFRHVTVPVDIIHGARTFSAVRQSLALWRDVLPQAKVWRIDGAGHLPIEEAPERVASIVFECQTASGRRP